MTNTQDPTQDSSQGAADPAQSADLEAQVKELTQQVQKLTEIAARAQADLQNAKTRMQRDREDLGRFALETTVKALLPVLDHFRRATAHLPKELEGNEWVKGVLSIEQELFRTLSDLGLQRMDDAGKQVDTARHDVITLGSGKEGEITDILEDGYELQGKVLRPA